ncbi:MAG: amidohydrolase family protein [Pseudomonadales bacterium]
MPHQEAGTGPWLARVTEDIIDPDQRIIDPHHHLWRRPGLDYLLEDLWQDTGSGHRVEKTVFVECHAEYRVDGPAAEAPLGETAFVAGEARRAESDLSQAQIAAIVGRLDLRLPTDQLRDLLDQHDQLGEGRFRGIRHAGAHARHPEALFIAGAAPEHLYQDENYRQGIRLLGHLGWTFDTWHYHYQNRDFLELAKACPETTMILDHFGTPLGVGPYADSREARFGEWQDDVARIASECPNVVAKLGGMAMPDNGFGWSERDRPATSDEFVEAQRPYYLHMIECFGARRCMMESNFPVDKYSISYPVLYNGLKKIVAHLSSDDRDQLFYGTAAQVYRLE